MNLSLVTSFILFLPVITIYFNFINFDSDDEDIVCKRDAFFTLIVAASLLVALFKGKNILSSHSGNSVSIGAVFVTAIVIVGISSLEIKLNIGKKSISNIRRNLEAMAVALILFSLITFFSVENSHETSKL